MIGCGDRIQAPLYESPDVGAGVLDGPPVYRNAIVTGTGRRGRRPLQHIVDRFAFIGNPIGSKIVRFCVSQNHTIPCRYPTSAVERMADRLLTNITSCTLLSVTNWLRLPLQ